MTRHTHSHVRSFLAPGAVLLAMGITTSTGSHMWAQGGPKRPRITGVAAFAAKVSDLAEARNFYSKILGLEEPFTIKNPLGGSDLTAFKINDRQFVYVAPDLKTAEESRLLFVSFETNDAKGLRNYLESKGV